MPLPTDDVLWWLDDRADEMAETVSELVAIDTENPPGRNLGRCGRLVAATIDRLGLAAELIALDPAGGLEDPCVVRGGTGGGERVVYFHGHFDVVPAQDPAQLRPRRESGRIVGRGTADMKGGLVSMLYGAAAAKELGLLDDGRIVLHAVCDEETGSHSGSRYLREQGLIDANALAMLTAEPTGGVVWNASRGGITMRVTVGGREAHVGQAHLGDNAFEKMLEVAQPLVALSQELDSPLVVGGAAAAGASFNVVPGSAWFSLDRRFEPDEDLGEELTRLHDTIAEAGTRAGAEVTVAVLQQAPSAATDASHPAAAALAHCIEAVEGETPRFETCPGVLETRWYAQLGIPAFAYGAGRLDVSHGPDELIEERAMRRCAAVYALAAAELLRR